MIENPIELTRSSVTEISGIPTLSNLIARRISELARNGKDIKNIIKELNLSRESAWLLQNCAYISDRKKTEDKPFYLNSRTRAIEQMNRIRGFQNQKFTGTRTDLYQRLNTGTGNYHSGILLTKDMGEQFGNGFISGYVNAEFGKLKMTLGDFYLQSGYGNILWNINAMGKSSDVISPANQFANTSINYKSSGEFGFLRGGVISGEIPIGDSSELGCIGWVSRTPRSATIDSATNKATSLYETGQFRTATEISKMHTLTESTYGAITFLRTGNIIAGAASYFLNYDKEVQSESSGIFSGKSGLFSSLYFMFTSKSLSIGTEVSRDPNGFMAYKLSGLYKYDDIELAIHGRAFTERFRSPFGYLFGETSSPANEYGLYTGLTYTGINALRFSAYIDLYSSFGPTYYIPEKTDGIDIFSEAQYFFNNNSEFRLRLQYETKTDAITLDSKTKEKAIFYRTKYSSRLEYIHYLSEIFRIKGRIDANLVNFEMIKSAEAGFAGYLEFTASIVKKFRLGTRLAYFTTKSYESAIWQYEMILPGYVSSPPLYGNGFRTFVSVSYIPIESIQMSAHYSLMKRYNVESLSSGNTEIMGNTDSRFYIQVDVRL